MSGKRGIVISPPFEVLGPRSISLGVKLGPSPADLRKYLLYWDEIDYVDNNFLSIGSDLDMEFLITAGVAERTRVQFQNVNSVSSEGGEFLLLAQHEVFEKRDKESPGLWSLAQISSSPYFAHSEINTAIEYQLWNTLPVPQSDVPLNDILEFKEKRYDELVTLRHYLDEMYQSVISAADIPRARTSAISKLETALTEIDRVLGESGMAKSISSLRGYISGEFTNIVGTGLGVAEIAPFIEMSRLDAFVFGAGIAFAVKPALSPKVRKGSHTLTYVSSIRKEL